MACLTGQDMDFDEFYQKFYNYAFKTAWLIVGDRQLAEDTVQQVFLELLSKHRKGLSLDDAAGLITRLTTFRAIDQQRATGQQPIPVDPIALVNLVNSRVTDDNMYYGSLEHEELVNLMRGWIDSLRPEYKQVIVMSYYDDMTAAEIATALASPIGSIKTWLHRSKRVLRGMILRDKQSSDYIGKQEQNAGAR